MSDELIIYLLGILPNIKCGLDFIAGVSFILFFIVGMLFFADYPGENNIIKKWVKIIIIIFSLSSILDILIPSNAILYALVGTHILKQTEIPQKVVTVLNKKLDDLIKNDVNSNHD